MSLKSLQPNHFEEGYDSKSLSTQESLKEEVIDFIKDEISDHYSFYHSAFHPLISHTTLQLVRFLLFLGCLSLFILSAFKFEGTAHIFYLTNWGSNFAVMSSAMTIYAGMKQEC